MRSAMALTDREIEILRLVSIAMSNSQIAIELYVSEATVKRHLTNIFTKLKARSRLDAVNRASALGILEGPVGRPILS
jgi:ATP/maltotriose-dependent transcriptional regulator MalT